MVKNSLVKINTKINFPLEGTVSLLEHDFNNILDFRAERDSGAELSNPLILQKSRFAKF